MMLFGLLFCVLFVTLLFVYKLNVIILSALILVQLAGLMFKKVLRIEFATLTLITLPIGSVVSFIAIGLIFYLIVVPIALLKNRKYQSGWIDSISDINPQKLHE